MGKTITFFDLSKRKYRILIDGGASTAADNLDGGAATMETEEDADTDIFMPVRTQTGYFRFIGTNDHSTWLSLIPSNSLSKRPPHISRTTLSAMTSHASHQAS